jgi:4-hydroxybutyrate CoA-transferase
MPVIAVKYCGGCNPRYDRVKLAQALREDLPEFEFSGADAPDPDFVLVVYGCQARCVAHEHITGRLGKLFAASMEDRGPLAEALKKSLRDLNQHI